MGTLLAFSILMCFLVVPPAHAATYNLTPTGSWKATLQGLVAGDIVYLASGDYNINGYAEFNWNGGPTTPIVVQNAAGASPRIVQSANQNIFNVKGSNFVVRGLTFANIGSAGRGIVMTGGTNVLMENLKLLNLADNAVSANSNGITYTNLTFRGIDVGFTGGTGECFYLGCVDDACRVNGGLLENNYCHDTCMPSACSGGSKGSGYQIKPGTNNVIVRNNVCYNTYGVCILLYDDYNRGQNIAEGNLVITVRADNGIQAAAGVIIRNNIVYNTASDGISMTSNPTHLMPNASPRNYVITGNTVVKAAAYCLRITTPTPRNSVTIANNAILCDGAGSAFFGADQTGVTWTKNAYNNGSPPPGTSAGVFAVGASTAELINPSGFNFYPKSTSLLKGAGALFSAGYDFNALARDPCAVTAGALQWSSAANPGFIFTTGSPFKTLAGSNQCVQTSCTLPSCSPTTATTIAVTTSNAAAAAAVATTNAVTTSNAATVAATTSASTSRAVTTTAASNAATTSNAAAAAAAAVTTSNAAAVTTSNAVTATAAAAVAASNAVTTSNAAAVTTSNAVTATAAAAVTTTNAATTSNAAAVTTSNAVTTTNAASVAATTNVAATLAATTSASVTRAASTSAASTLNGASTAAASTSAASTSSVSNSNAVSLGGTTAAATTTVAATTNAVVSTNAASTSATVSTQAAITSSLASTTSVSSAAAALSSTTSVASTSSASQALTTSTASTSSASSTVIAASGATAAASTTNAQATSIASTTSTTASAATTTTSDASTSAMSSTAVASTTSSFASALAVDATSATVSASAQATTTASASTTSDEVASSVAATVTASATTSLSSTVSDSTSTSTTTTTSGTSSTSSSETSVSAVTSASTSSNNGATTYYVIATTETCINASKLFDAIATDLGLSRSALVLDKYNCKSRQKTLVMHSTTDRDGSEGNRITDYLTTRPDTGVTSARVSTSKPSSKKKLPLPIWAFIVIGVGALVFIAIGVGFVVFLVMRKSSPRGPAGRSAAFGAASQSNWMQEELYGSGQGEYSTTPYRGL